MIKYATSIRKKPPRPRRSCGPFQRTNKDAPDQAMQEVGRAQRTMFIVRYLRDRELQREINAGLNVAEAWNFGNSVIFFGKGSDIPGNRRDQ